MAFKFCLLTADEAKDGRKIGYAYANKIKDRWISSSASGLKEFLTVGYVKGEDFVYKDGKAYKICKSYIDLDNNLILILCTEVTSGCETMEF